MYISESGLGFLVLILGFRCEKTNSMIQLCLYGECVSIGCGTTVNVKRQQVRYLRVIRAALDYLHV